MSTETATTETISIVFDGPPAHESGRFIEVENSSGESIKVGEWFERANGTWELRIPHAQPRVLGYVVVGRDGVPMKHPMSQDRGWAQAQADEWTQDCKDAGVDWDYRVAEIVEAAK